MSDLSAAGITLTLPPGWEAEISTVSTGDFTPELSPGVKRAQDPVIVHVGNFRLPQKRGDYGGGVLELLAPGDVFISIIDFGTEAASQPLFAHEGVPTLSEADFSPNTIVRGLPGRSGCQRFFSMGGRGFCLYVVVGSHADRADLVGDINATVGTLRVE